VSQIKIYIDEDAMDSDIDFTCNGSVPGESMPE